MHENQAGKGVDSVTASKDRVKEAENALKEIIAAPQVFLFIYA
jgi:hypothetical protein